MHLWRLLEYTRQYLDAHYKRFCVRHVLRLWFKGDATDPASSMSNSNLKVYPNPVRPDYHGKVHITGLMMNSNVKIVSAAGKLVAEGTSIGGEFSWDGCMQSGRRVTSGIYYALCTDEEGNKGACAKILIVHP